MTSTFKEYFAMPNLRFLTVNFVYHLALAVWIGGNVMLFLSAPVIFGRVPSRSAAGEIVWTILGRFDAVKAVCAAALLTAVALRRRWFETTQGRIAWRWDDTYTWQAIRNGAVLALVALLIVNALVLSPMIHRIRDQAGDITSLPEGDPMRARFGMLHGLSMLCSLLEVVAGLAAMFPV